MAKAVETPSDSLFIAEWLVPVKEVYRLMVNLMGVCNGKFLMIFWFYVNFMINFLGI